MYTYKKINIDGRMVLAIELNQPKQFLINFCIILRANFRRKHPIERDPDTYRPEELKKAYQQELISTIQEQNHALVDLATGEIINPSRLSKEQIIEDFQGPLPF